MIHSISFENYKSFKDKTKIDLKPITILVGPNSSGKSSILKLFGLLHQSFMNGREGEFLRLQGEDVDLGDIHKISHKDNLPVKFEFKTDKSNIVFELSNNNNKLTFEDSDFSFVADNKSTFAQFTLTDNPLKIINNYLYPFLDKLERITLLVTGGEPQQDNISNMIREIYIQLTEKNENFLKPVKFSNRGLDIKFVDTFIFDYTEEDLKIWENKTEENNDESTSYFISPWFVFNLINSDDQAHVDSSKKIIADGKVAPINTIFAAMATGDYATFLKANPSLVSDTGEGDKSVIDELLSNDFEEKPRRVTQTDEAGNVESDIEVWEGLNESDELEKILSGIIAYLELTKNKSKREKVVEDFWNETFPRFVWKVLLKTQIDTNKLRNRFFAEMYKNIKDIKIVKPLRPFPQREYIIEVLKDEYNLSHFSESEIEKLFSERVYSSLKLLDVNYKIYLKKDVGDKYFGERWALVLENEESKTEQSIVDVGFGISQLLPILIALQSNATLAIEQPELHLHPKSQAKLSEIFYETVSTNKEKKLLLETHSEHLVRGFQVLVAQGKMQPEDIAIYYVDKNDEGNSFVKKMELDGRGYFTEEWPEGFFDIASNQSYQLLEAIAKK
ncbi:MAG: DUF3696 domain-containing protein [Ignavibacteriales bacterium]|nr:DUF3696 domain-containing protein [Ignavibacteriales bacterium]